MPTTPQLTVASQTCKTRAGGRADAQLLSPRLLTDLKYSNLSPFDTATRILFIAVSSRTLTKTKFKYGQEKVQWNEDWIDDTRPSIGVPQELLSTSPNFIGVVGAIFNSGIRFTLQNTLLILNV